MNKINWLDSEINPSSLYTLTLHVIPGNKTFAYIEKLEKGDVGFLGSVLGFLIPEEEKVGEGNVEESRILSSEGNQGKTLLTRISPSPK